MTVNALLWVSLCSSRKTNKSLKVVYVEEPLVGGKCTTCLFVNGPILLFWHTEWMWNKDYSTDYHCNIWTNLNIVSEVVYVSLPKMGKLANKIIVTWRANLCHLSLCWTKVTDTKNIFFWHFCVTHRPTSFSFPYRTSAVMVLKKRNLGCCIYVIRMGTQMLTTTG